MSYLNDAEKGNLTSLESILYDDGYHPIRKNVGNSGSRKIAINAMCAHCMGCTEKELNPGYRSDIRNCTASNCPLYHFRPYQEK